MVKTIYLDSSIDPVQLIKIIDQLREKNKEIRLENEYLKKRIDLLLAHIYEKIGRRLPAQELL